MKISALISNINSILNQSGSKLRVGIDNVDFIVHHVFKLDIPDDELTFETVEKIISVSSKYPEFKTHEQAKYKGVNLLRLLFDMNNKMSYAN